MSNEKLTTTVLSILRRPGVEKIAFDLSGLCVTGQRYAMVAKAIADGSIECEAVDQFESQGKDELADGMVTEARYVTKKNAMLFPRDDYGTSNPREERTIFHESTHAIFDLLANSHADRTLAIHDESAAVLAEALYIRLSGRPVAGFAMWKEGPQDEALQLADQMITEIGDFETNKRTYFLKTKQTEKLRNAVAKDWHFTKFIDSDGRPTDNSGVKYIYDGVVKCYSCWVNGQ